MKNKDLIAKLQKYDPEVEVYIAQEWATPAAGIYSGFYVCNEYDRPDVVCCSEEDKAAYDIPETQERVIVIE